jgi:hypothetical protein
MGVILKGNFNRNLRMKIRLIEVIPKVVSLLLGSTGVSSITLSFFEQPGVSYEYSFDNTTWVSLPANKIITGVSSQVNSVRVRGVNKYGIGPSSNIVAFSINAAPVWSTPSGSIGTLRQGENFSYIFTATDSDGVQYSIVSATPALPETVGLIPSANSSTLAGYFTSDILSSPTWNTPAGSLGVMGKDTVFTTTLSATAAGSATIQKMNVVNSYLPAGIILSFSGNTGTLSGTTDFYSASLEPVVVLDGPIWSNDAGSLGTARNGQSISISLSAAKSGKTVTYSVLSGFIPAGTTLSSGVISGTLDAGTSTATLSSNRVFSFTIRATASDASFTDRSFTYTVTT